MSIGQKRRFVIGDAIEEEAGGVVAAVDSCRRVKQFLVGLVQAWVGHDRSECF